MLFVWGRHKCGGLGVMLLLLLMRLFKWFLAITCRFKPLAQHICASVTVWIIPAALKASAGFGPKVPCT